MSRTAKSAACRTIARPQSLRVLQREVAMRIVSEAKVHTDTLRNVQPPDPRAGFVLANRSMSSNQSGEGDIRRALIEADLEDCMVALPGQLFHSTQIPVCPRFLAKNKNADAKRAQFCE